MRSLFPMHSMILVGIACLVSVAHAEELLLEVVDQGGQPLPARVRVRDESGRDFFPTESLEVPLGKDHWFISPGVTKLEVPSGRIELRIERGPEYQPEKLTILCKAGQTTRHRVELLRWIDMRERGYLCGENHLHVPLEQLGPQLVAEGLDFGTSLQWWNARRFETSPTGGEVRLLQYAGTTVPTTPYDYEIEHEWGAVYVVGQPTPLAIEDDSDMPNLPTIRQSHAAGALVCYQGGWSREVLLDALLGYVDVVNVCNNNFFRHAYQPRSRYSNLLQVPNLPSYANDAQGMLRMNTDTYYRLLNCGLQLAAGAGSATGAKRSPVGYNRAYVRVGEEATLQQFLEAWRQGKNFVTNGPMLFLKAEHSFHPGDTIELGADGATLDIEVTAHFPQPMNVEIVLNGRVVHRSNVLQSGSTTFSVPIKIGTSAWLAARCTAEDPLLSDPELAAYAWGSKRMPRKPTRLRFAHTSPIYISLDGKKTRVEKSVQEAHQMLDALANYADEKTSGKVHHEIVGSLDEARKRLGK